MSEPEENFDNEFRQQVFDRFEKRSSAFSVTYRATIVFTFAFLAFVLVPLVALEYDDHRIRAQEADWELKKATVKKLQDRISEIDARLPEITQAHAQTQQEVEAKEDALAEIEMEEEGIQLQIDKNTQNLNLYTGKAQEFKQLQTRFEALGAYDPRASAQELIDAFAQMLEYGSRPDTTGPCASSDMYRFVKCKVENSLQTQLKDYKQVIMDADELLLQYETLDGVKPINDKIDDVMNALNQLYAQYPDFWNTVRGKFFFFGEFQGPMNKVFDEAGHQMKRYGDALERKKNKIDTNFTQLESTGSQLNQKRARIIETQEALSNELEISARQIQTLKSEEQRLKAELGQRQSELNIASQEFEKLDQEKKAIADSKKEIEARLEKVQSPFGTIPVRLKEALLVFPLIVAVGIAMYSLILIELLHLRKAFHRATGLLYPDGGPKLDRRVAMVAPLWVDPLGTRRSNIWGCLLLALPMLAFFLSLLLIGYSWTLSGDQPGSTLIIQRIYILVYALGAIGITLCFGLIFKQWKQY